MACNQMLLMMSNYIFTTIHGTLVNATIIRNAYFKEEFSKTKKKSNQKKI